MSIWNQLLMSLAGGGNSTGQSVMAGSDSAQTLTAPQQQAVSQDDEIPVTARNTPEHEGLFGQKGQLRDILGAVGDAFLVHAGRQPQYAPQRDKERFSDALSGYDTPDEAPDPKRPDYVPDNHFRNAMQRLTDAGFGQEAFKMSEMHGKNDVAELYKTAQADALRDKALTTFGGIAGAALRGGAEGYDRLKPMMAAILKRNNITDIALPDKFDEKAIQDLAAMGTPEYQQKQAEIRIADLIRKRDQGNARLALAGRKEDNRVAGRGFAPPRPQKGVSVLDDNGDSILVRPEDSYGRRPTPTGKGKSTSFDKYDTTASTKLPDEWVKAGVVIKPGPDGKPVPYLPNGKPLTPVKKN